MNDEETTTMTDAFAESVESWEPPKLDPHLDFFVYGSTGAGKTTLIKTLREDCLSHDAKALLLTNDKGEESILSALHDPEKWLIPREVETMDDIRAAAKYLITRDHPFRWVALDDTTRMAQIMNAELKEEFGDDVWGRYSSLNDRFRKLLRKFRGLDINSLFLAREGEEDVEDGKKTAAFPGKALGEGNDRSSVLHEFTFGFRMIRQPRDGEPDHFYLLTTATSEAEAKKRDEWHVLDKREEPNISKIRRKWLDAQRQHLDNQ